MTSSEVPLSPSFSSPSLSGSDSCGQEAASHRGRGRCVSRRQRVNAVAILCLVLWGCAATPRFGEKNSADHGANEKSNRDTPSRDAEPSRVTTGKALLTLQGIVSYYADDFHGKQTSNGETFNMNDLTAAHRTFPFGTKVRVTNLENNKTVVVRVNDRGPFVEGRIMDLSLAAARQIDLMKSGTTHARLEVIQWGDGR